MKAHHLQPMFSVWGSLVYCLNELCSREFLTVKDMEMHCSMKRNSSNNPCLQSFIEVKVLAKEQVLHSSSQIDISTGCVNENNPGYQCHNEELLYLGRSAPNG
jgi:hypothetical protein